jgi:hypothetical protein
MVAAMFAGMVVLGKPLGLVLGHSDPMMLVNMGVAMTLPMVGWMRYRGHEWRPTLEMAASMVLPTLMALSALAAGAQLGPVLLAEHVVMLVAMLGVMVLRSSEYLHHAAAAA